MEETPGLIQILFATGDFVRGPGQCQDDRIKSRKERSRNLSR